MLLLLFMKFDVAKLALKSMQNCELDVLSLAEPDRRLVFSNRIGLSLNVRLVNVWISVLTCIDADCSN